MSSGSENSVPFSGNKNQNLISHNNDIDKELEEEIKLSRRDLCRKLELTGDVRSQLEKISNSLYGTRQPGVDVKAKSNKKLSKKDKELVKGHIKIPLHKAKNNDDWPVIDKVLYQSAKQDYEEVIAALEEEPKVYKLLATKEKYFSETKKKEVRYKKSRITRAHKSLIDTYIDPFAVTKGKKKARIYLDKKNNGFKEL